jgi:hypothetical protein
MLSFVENSALNKGSYSCFESIEAILNTDWEQEIFNCISVLEKTNE